jgi:hypothetical protein
LIRIVLPLLVLLSACAPTPPPSVWQRPDVSEATARGVERDCRQRAILDIPAANGPADAQAVHLERDRYVERCMAGSGFSRLR